jgi:hypothetical protein
MTLSKQLGTCDEGKFDKKKNDCINQAKCLSAAMLRNRFKQVQSQK